MKKPKISIKLLAHNEKKLMKSLGFRQAFQLCLLKFKLRTNKALSFKIFWWIYSSKTRSTNKKLNFV